MTPARGSLLGSHELAARWGITRARVFQILARDPRMPPGEKLHGGHVWTVTDIEEYERLTGRPPVEGTPLVRRSPAHQEVTRGRWRGFHVAAHEAGLRDWADPTRISDAPPPAEAALYLGVTEDVVTRARRHGVIYEGRRVPVMLSWTWFHPDIARELPVVREADTGEGGVTSRFRDAGYTPAWDEVLGARNASVEEAAALEVPTGKALGESWRTCTDAAARRVLEVTLMVYNPDRYQLTFPP